MDNKIIDKFLKFINENLSSSVKKDFTWLSKTIIEDLEKLTNEKKTNKKRH